MLLSLTCSSSVGSVTLSDGEKILDTLSWESERSHAEFVSLKIAEITAKPGLKALTALAVDVGPGSFTGIRIAVNTVKTLAYALNLPIVFANSLELICHQIPPSDLPAICLIDAFSQSVYAAGFNFSANAWTPAFGPKVVNSLEIKSLFKSKSLCLGDGFQKYATEIAPVKSHLIFEPSLSNVPSAEVLAKLGAIKLQNGLSVSWQTLEPLYIRRSSAEEKLLV